MAKLKTDLTEIKEERRKEVETISQKLRQAEQLKAEFAAREETTRESLAQSIKERERLETDFEEKILNIKKEAQRGI